MNRRKFILTASAAGIALATRAGDATPKLRVGVIGHTGRGNYGHGLDIMWLQIPETEIVAVADGDSKGLANELKKLKLKNGFSDYREMLAQTKPDIVAIAPRHLDQHRDMALAAIEAGARGIYIEKPFCRSPAEADEVVAAATKRNVRFAVAHRNRWHPVLPVVQKLIADDAIGRVLEIRARGKEDQRGGSLDLWVLGCHLFNLSTVFAGKPVACSATVLQGGKPVTRAHIKAGDEGVGPLAGNEVHARFETASGIPVFFDSIVKAGTKEAGFGVQIVATKGVIDFRIDIEPLAHIRTGNPHQPTGPAGAWVPITTGGIGKPEPILNLGKQVSGHTLGGRDLVGAVREKRETLCSAHDGATTVEMICSVFESHRLGGQRVTLPLKIRENPLSLL